jgi:REP element-mobilizing transposase RayT
MDPNDRKTARLRWGRVSIPAARYFISVCTQHRAPVLTHRDHAARSMDALLALHAASDVELLAATIMPDHAHLLFALGARLTIGQVMAKFKTLARDGGHVTWHWQQDGFEHQLRTGESEEDYGFYVFMNPYRAQLLSTAQIWPWWVCPEPSQFLFLQQLNADGTPPPEWLDKIEDVANRVVDSD